jgi:hypothetical protein
MGRALGSDDAIAGPDVLSDGPLRAPVGSDVQVRRLDLQGTATVRLHVDQSASR